MFKRILYHCNIAFPACGLHPSFANIIFVFLCVALQIQTTILGDGHSSGLRINLGDIALPFIGIFIMISLMRAKTSWPQWHPPFNYIWPIALTLIIGGALVNGYLSLGVIISWALINKFLGWLILMAYLGCGAWIATNFKDAPLKCARTITSGFLYITIILIILELVSHLGFSNNISAIIKGNFAGAMGNRNAYAFLMLIVCVFSSVFTLKDHTLLPKLITPLFWILVPTLLMSNGSRALWLCFGLLAPIFVIINWRYSLKILAPCLVIGVLLFSICTHGLLEKHRMAPLSRITNLKTQILDPTNDRAQNLSYKTGDGYRIDILKSSILAWTQRPVLGQGLGYTKHTRTEQHGQLINVIDNSLLWVLTEMGALGFLTFLGAYSAMILSLKRQYSNIKNNKDTRSIFALCCLLMLLTFGVFSIFHEILYTRIFWFILGIGLVMPKTHDTNAP